MGGKGDSHYGKYITSMFSLKGQQMKQNLDLVRLILIETEAATDTLDLHALMDASEDKAYTAKEIAFHIELMQAYGLIDAVVERSWSDSPTRADVLALTWEGYDYLDAIRSETVWRQAKQAIKETIGVAPLAVVKDVCITLGTSLVKARLGI